MKNYKFTVEEENTVRLDKYLSSRLEDTSRTFVQSLIEEGHVLVNGSREKAGFKLKAGDEIDVTIPPEKPCTLTPQKMPLSIVYENEDLLVLNKPAGLTVHPAPGHPDHTLINALLAHLPSLPEGSDALRPGIVHRLDKDTSGLILIAKNSHSLAVLSEQFKERTVNKTYLVLVKGHLTPKEGIIEAPIGRDPSDRKKMAVITSGREARSKYTVEKYINGYTLLKVHLETGRTHQIRVHFAAIGFPIAGDSTYGVKVAEVPRQFVHAYKLGFTLPGSNEYVEFTAELPADLQNALESLT